jgi:hypothetical protein
MSHTVTDEFGSPLKASQAARHIRKRRPTLPVAMRSLAFQVRKGLPANDVVLGALGKAVGSQTSVDETRHLHGAVWAS